MNAVSKSIDRMKGHIMRLYPIFITIFILLSCSQAQEVLPYDPLLKIVAQNSPKMTTRNDVEEEVKRLKELKIADEKLHKDQALIKGPQVLDTPLAPIPSYNHGIQTQEDVNHALGIQTQNTKNLEQPDATKYFQSALGTMQYTTPSGKTYEVESRDHIQETIAQTRAHNPAFNAILSQQERMEKLKQNSDSVEQPSVGQSSDVNKIPEHNNACLKSNDISVLLSDKCLNKTQNVPSVTPEQNTENTNCYIKTLDDNTLQTQQTILPICLKSGIEISKKHHGITNIVFKHENHLLGISCSHTQKTACHIINN